MIDSYFSNIENILNDCDFIERIEINKHIKNEIIESHEPELILIIKEIKDIKFRD